MTIKMMLVPGAICSLELPEGSTVLDAAQAAETAKPLASGQSWTELVKDREVRVQNRKFSNVEEVPEGYFGSINTTPLEDGQVVLILTKIKGNDAVITCYIDGKEFALETPVQAQMAMAEAAGIDLDDVDFIRINGEEAELDRLVGSGDRIEVIYFEPEPDFDEYIEPEAAEIISVTINGCRISGSPEDIRRLLGC